MSDSSAKTDLLQTMFDSHLDIGVAAALGGSNVDRLCHKCN